MIAGTEEREDQAESASAPGRMAGEGVAEATSPSGGVSGAGETSGVGAGVEVTSGAGSEVGVASDVGSGMEVTSGVGSGVGVGVGVGTGSTPYRFRRLGPPQNSLDEPVHTMSQRFSSVSTEMSSEPSPSELPQKHSEPALVNSLQNSLNATHLVHTQHLRVRTRV